MKKILVLFVAVCAIFVSCQKENVIKEGENVSKKIEDAVFLKYCCDNFDTNNDGIISMQEAAAVKIIYCEGAGITSLKGIEYFTAITRLNCTNNRISSLDISKNTQLEDLLCSHNNITSLDLSKNTQLKKIECNNNNPTSLDVSRNTLLEYFIYNPQNNGDFIFPTGWKK